MIEVYDLMIEVHSVSPAQLCPTGGVSHIHWQACSSTVLFSLPKLTDCSPAMPSLESGLLTAALNTQSADISLTIGQ